jgi:hypothetical protein
VVPEAVVCSHSLRSPPKNFLFRQTHRVARNGGLLSQKAELHTFHVTIVSNRATASRLETWRGRGHGVVPTLLEIVASTVDDGRQFGAAAAGLA